MRWTCALQPCRPPKRRHLAAMHWLPGVMAVPKAAIGNRRRTCQEPSNQDAWYWVDAPGGYLVGEMGAVVVENHDGGQSLPAEGLPCWALALARL